MRGGDRGRVFDGFLSGFGGFFLRRWGRPLEELVACLQYVAS
jgi:hypothetical protein